MGLSKEDLKIEIVKAKAGVKQFKIAVDTHELILKAFQHELTKIERNG